MSTSGDNGYVAPWIDSEDCTACGECININGKLFVYNDKKQAEIGDEDAGSFKDLVKAAEKCPSRIIHPGTPKDMSEKNVDKLMKRAEKFQ